jgi:hypothetical protein
MKDYIQNFDISPAIANAVRDGQYSIYTVLDAVRLRPGLYIGKVSPEHLFVFLGAYQMAMQHAGLEEISEPPFDGFHDWVATRFGFFESTAGWANMIMAVGLGLNPKNILWENYDANATDETHQQALDTFFTLLDHYRQ